MAERTPSDRQRLPDSTSQSERLRHVLDQRSDVLATLLERPLTKPELVEQLDVSRSTVDRALKTLTAQGLVRRDGTSFVVSATGRLGCESVERHHRTTADVVRTAPLLKHLPPDADIEPALLKGASVHQSTSDAGRQALRAAMSIVSGADTVYACARAVTDTSAPTAAYRLVVEAGAALEVVYASNVAEYIRREHVENRREMVSTGRYRAFETASLPFGLFIATAPEGTKVAVALYDENETLVGVLTNDSEAAVEWAESTYHRYRRGATEFTNEFAPAE